MSEREERVFEDVTRVKRCPDCRGTGVTGHVKVGDTYQAVTCRNCLGNGQVLYLVREEAGLPTPIAGARP